MRWMIRVVAIGLALLAIASLGLADDQQPPRWQFEFMPYAWIPGTFGTIQVKGRTASVDADIGDVLTLFGHGDAFALGGYFAARYDRWSAFVDAWGGFANVPVSETIPIRLGTLQVSATARLRPVIADFVVGYQLGEWSLPDRKRPISLGAYLGTRYTYLGTELDASGSVDRIQGAGRSVSEGFETFVPLIGVRLELPLLDALSFDFRGDVGGLPGQLVAHVATNRRSPLLAPLGAIRGPDVARGGLPGGRVRPGLRRRQRREPAAARPPPGHGVRVLMIGGKISGA
jgi:hypothetical protein